jgi:hypothetical protein
LRKYGTENPKSNLRDRVKGIGFGELIEIKDPYTKLPIKKEIKPYMVDNLRQYLEKSLLLFPVADEELYMQLISYVVVRTTQTGRPVFEAGGSAVDHAHDAVMLALLAITENYGEFGGGEVATNVESFSNTFFMPKNQGKKDDDNTNKESGIILKVNRTAELKPRFSKKGITKKIARKMF